MEPPKPPEPVSSTKPPGVTLPTTGNGGVGGIRALALLPLGAKRAVAGNRHVQIPTLLAGTARCSIWRLEPQGGIEMAAGAAGGFPITPILSRSGCTTARLRKMRQAWLLS